MPNELGLAPAITFTAVGSGREVSLQSPGIPALLLVLAQETQHEADAVEAAVRAKWPDATQVLVAHIVDLRKIPGLFHKVAEGVMSSEYEKAARTLAPGRQPFDYCVILPDWKGEVATSLELPEPSKSLSGVVLRVDGCVQGTFVGSDGEAALRLLTDATATE